MTPTFQVYQFGKNRKYNIRPALCAKGYKSFQYELYDIIDDSLYRIVLSSLDEGKMGVVRVYKGTSKKLIVERHNVKVRFHKEIFKV